MNTQQPALLDLQNVTVMRGENVALEKLSLRILSGEHVAILGPNGCGKSTLIKTITRECYPVARAGSSMTILGESRWDVFQLRSLLGIVSNDLMSLCTGRTCGRDVVLSGFFSSTGIFQNHAVTAQQRARADVVLAELQIEHLADRPVACMSSGEARRVLIARALVHKPAALLFDEPGNSLDAYARHSLRQTMRSLAASGIGIILVTHDLGDVIPEIDRILLMSKGRIVADGPKEEMLQPSRLEVVFGIKAQVARHDGYYHLW
ncbi:MAG: ATP-binding cassette domain-containing protein [Gammaproteobacteria bacterium]